MTTRVLHRAGRWCVYDIFSRGAGPAFLCVWVGESSGGRRGRLFFVLSSRARVTGKEKASTSGRAGVGDVMPVQISSIVVDRSSGYHQLFVWVYVTRVQSVCVSVCASFDSDYGSGLCRVISSVTISDYLCPLSSRGNNNKSPPTPPSTRHPDIDICHQHLPNNDHIHII